MLYDRFHVDRPRRVQTRIAIPALAYCPDVMSGPVSVSHLCQFAEIKREVSIIPVIVDDYYIYIVATIKHTEQDDTGRYLYLPLLIGHYQSVITPMSFSMHDVSDRVTTSDGRFYNFPENLIIGGRSAPEAVDRYFRSIVFYTHSQKLPSAPHIVETHEPIDCMELFLHVPYKTTGNPSYDYSTLARGITSHFKANLPNKKRLRDRDSATVSDFIRGLYIHG